jgi:hypothetical protein
LDSNLDVKINDIKDVDAVRFTASKILSGKQVNILDNDASDGFSASFNVPSGFYKLSATYYNQEKELGSELISRVLFINKDL